MFNKKKKQDLDLLTPNWHMSYGRNDDESKGRVKVSIFQPLAQNLMSK